MNKRIICYDNFGKSFDRYTVIYLDSPEKGENMFTARGMSENPTHPQGFGQITVAQKGRHLGKIIPFESLPLECQKVVNNDLNYLN